MSFSISSVTIIGLLLLALGMLAVLLWQNQMKPHSMIPTVVSDKIEIRNEAEEKQPQNSARRYRVV